MGFDCLKVCFCLVVLGELFFIIISYRCKFWVVVVVGRMELFGCRIVVECLFYLVGGGLGLGIRGGRVIVVE